MVDVKRTQAQIESDLQDNTTGLITPQRVRNAFRSVAQILTELSDSGAVDIDFEDVGDFVVLELTGDVTSFSITNGIPGRELVVAFLQGSGGPHTLAGDSGILWEGGSAPTLSTTEGHYDVFTFRCLGDGTWLEAKHAVQDAG